MGFELNNQYNLKYMHFCLLVIGSTDHNHLKQFSQNIKGLPYDNLLFKEDEDYDIDERTGKNGYWYNSKEMFDWYEIGGRFKNRLKTKKGYTDECLKEELLNANTLHLKITSILYYDDWVEVPYFSNMNPTKEEKNAWKITIAKILSEVDDQETLTIVDCHY